MPRFRKKSKIVEANQYTHPATAPLGVRTEEDGRAYVITAHLQKVYLESGDWILPEPDGVHFYPVKPDIFADCYESMEDDLLCCPVCGSANIYPTTFYGTDIRLCENENCGHLFDVSEGVRRAKYEAEKEQQ